MKSVFSQDRYLVGDVVGEDIYEEITEKIQSFLAVENIYVLAIREIVAKLENLREECLITMERNPIYQIKTRVKTPRSIMDKLIRKEKQISVESAKRNIDDIAGIRIICSYIDDIYLVAERITAQNDIKLIRSSDYVKVPKPNGYRSLHLIVTVPINLSTITERVKVEIQIRTIAMDSWASIEHGLVYKQVDKETDNIVKE